MKTHSLLAMVIASGLFVGASARADFVDIDLAGWIAAGTFGSVSNTSTSVDIGAFSSVTGFDWIALTFVANSPSYEDEFRLSVNTSDTVSYMDWSPSLLASSGAYGPGSGSWGGPSGAGIGGPFSVLADGILFVTVYETFNDPEVTPDAQVSAGTLRVHYTAVPEPTSAGLLALGATVVLFGWRKRR